LTFPWGYVIIRLPGSERLEGKADLVWKGKEKFSAGEISWLKGKFPGRQGCCKSGSGKAKWRLGLEAPEAADNWSKSVKVERTLSEMEELRGHRYKAERNSLKRRSWKACWNLVVLCTLLPHSSSKNLSSL